MTDYLSQNDHESPKPRLAQIGVDVARDLDALADVVDENLRHELRNRRSTRQATTGSQRESDGDERDRVVLGRSLTVCNTGPLAAYVFGLQ